MEINIAKDGQALRTAVQNSVVVINSQELPRGSGELLRQQLDINGTILKKTDGSYVLSRGKGLEINLGKLGGTGGETKIDILVNRQVEGRIVSQKGGGGKTFLHLQPLSSQTGNKVLSSSPQTPGTLSIGDLLSGLFVGTSTTTSASIGSSGLDNILRTLLGLQSSSSSATAKEGVIRGLSSKAGRLTETTGTSTASTAVSSVSRQSLIKGDIQSLFASNTVITRASLLTTSSTSVNSVAANNASLFSTSLRLGTDVQVLSTATSTSGGVSSQGGVSIAGSFDKSIQGTISNVNNTNILIKLANNINLLIAKNNLSSSVDVDNLAGKKVLIELAKHSIEASRVTSHGTSSVSSRGVERSVSSIVRSSATTNVPNPSATSTLSRSSVSSVSSAASVRQSAAISTTSNTPTAQTSNAVTQTSTLRPTITSGQPEQTLTTNTAKTGQPLSIGGGLSQGSLLSLRVENIKQASGSMNTGLSSKEVAEGHIVGQITSRSASTARLATSFGDILLATGDSKLVTGSVIELSLQKATASPKGIPDGQWKDLQEQLTQIAQTTPSILGNLANILPTINQSLGGTLLFFLMVLRGGNMQQWTSTSLRNSQTASAQTPILENLGKKFIKNSKVMRDINSNKLWREYNVPLATNDGIENLKISLAQDDNENNQNEEDAVDENAKEVQRFKIDIKFRDKGSFIFEGRTEKNNIELVVYTDQDLVSSLQEEIRTRFSELLETIGYKGSIFIRKSRESMVSGSLSFKDIEV